MNSDHHPLAADLTPQHIEHYPGAAAEIDNLDTSVYLKGIQ